MGTPFSDLAVIHSNYTQASFSSAETNAFTLKTCGYCGGTQQAVIAVASNSLWLRCIACRRPAVVSYGRQYPSSLPLSIPKGVTGRELQTWEEVRSCLGIGANSAATMLCRRLLLHVAVAHGLPEKNDKGRAPSFAEAIKFLEQEQIITAKMRPWVDRIKDVGNEANHELAPIDEVAAMDVARFTEQLLRLAYEMDALMNADE